MWIITTLATSSQQLTPNFFLKTLSLSCCQRNLLKKLKNSPSNNSDKLILLYQFILVAQNLKSFTPSDKLLDLRSRGLTQSCKGISKSMMLILLSLPDLEELPEGGGLRTRVSFSNFVMQPRQVATIWKVIQPNLATCTNM